MTKQDKIIENIKDDLKRDVKTMLYKPCRIMFEKQTKQGMQVLRQFFKNEMQLCRNK
ncbi:MAG: hypothetical protein WC666_03935 [Candidatus Paceibacterota bacterium]|jgi:hypothetical protein